MNRTRIITIGGTFLCALGIGFFMQNIGSEQPAPGVPAEPVARADFKPLSEPAFSPTPLPEPTAPTVEPASDATIAATADPEIPAAAVSDNGERSPVADTPAADGDAVEEIAVLDEPVSAEEPVLPVAEPEAEELACAVNSTATTDAAAMIRLQVAAPCLGNERVVVHHNGLMFTAVTDGSGDLDVMVPALAEMAVIIVEFANGEGTVATTEVSSLSFYNRVVLQWAGDEGFQLHAREYGADYGSDGHVWSGATRDASAAALGEGGFVTRLGAPDTPLPRLAEVYTFPSRTAAQSGQIDLSIEAEVTAGNCGQDIEAQSLERAPDGDVRTQYLTLSVPGCDTIGDFLVLNNLVDDLTIAAN